MGSLETANYIAIAAVIIALLAFILSCISLYVVRQDNARSKRNDLIHTLNDLRMIHEKISSVLVDKMNTLGCLWSNDAEIDKEDQHQEFQEAVAHNSLASAKLSSEVKSLSSGSCPDLKSIDNRIGQAKKSTADLKTSLDCHQQELDKLKAKHGSQKKFKNDSKARFDSMRRDY